MSCNWFACELHCHTLHSDGAFSPEELMNTASERLLDGIALTDHNTQSAVPLAMKCDSPVLLPGVELTTFYGHMPLLKPDSWVEWRDLTYKDGDILVNRAKQAGALVGIAHPFQLGTPICTGGHWDYIVDDMNKVDYMEIWSEGCPYLNSSNIRAVKLWHSYLDKRIHITPTMGRDWHRKEGNIYPAACTYLGADCDTFSEDVMLAAIKRGRTVISAGPLFVFETSDGKTIGDTVEAGEHSVCFSADYRRSDLLNKDTPIKCKEIRIVSNNEKIAERISVDEHFKDKTANLTFFADSWYSAELWGSICDKENELIAVTAAVFAV